MVCSELCCSVAVDVCQCQWVGSVVLVVLPGVVLNVVVVFSYSMVLFISVDPVGVVSPGLVVVVLLVTVEVTVVVTVAFGDFVDVLQ